MDGAKLQAKVYEGYAKAAKRIGLPFALYRPTTSTHPLAVPLASILASFNAQDMTYSRPNTYGKAVWWCLADGRVLMPGDYLVRGDSTFFIAGMPPMLPIQAVECNRIVTIYRPQQQVGVGALPYGGNTAQSQTAIVTGFPVSVLAASKTGHAPTNLPGDVADAWYTLLLPALPGGVQMLPHDVVTDDLNTRYVISAVELSALGWRCSVMQAET